MTIQYSLKRSNLWHGYWRQWRRSWKLKAMQLVIAVLVFYIALQRLSGTGPARPRHVVLAGLVTCLVLAFLPIYPLLRFKPQQRTLTISPEGVSTAIGKVQGDVSWRKIDNIFDEADAIYIVGRSQSSFMVPDHAFASPTERETFLGLARQWFEGSRQGGPSEKTRAGSSECARDGEHHRISHGQAVGDAQVRGRERKFLREIDDSSFSSSWPRHNSPPRSR